MLRQRTSIPFNGPCNLLPLRTRATCSEDSSVITGMFSYHTYARITNIPLRYIANNLLRLRSVNARHITTISAMARARARDVQIYEVSREETSRREKHPAAMIFLHAPSYRALLYVIQRRVRMYT